MTIGRVLADDQDRGAGFTTVPGVVVIANHLLSDRDTAALTFAQADGSKVQVVKLEGDESLDAAVLQLADALLSDLRVSRPVQGAAWRIETRLG